MYRDSIRILASDDFKGRKAGTGGEEQSVNFLVQQFRKLGLKPGNGASFLQAVPITEITVEPGAALSYQTANKTQSLPYGEQMMIWTRQPLPTLQIQSSPAVFVGFGTVAPEFNWDDYAGFDVRGKTVIVLVNDPGFGSKDPTVFRGGAMTAYGRWDYKLAEAGRHGAAAVLLIHDGAATGFPWAAVQSTWRGSQLQLQQADAQAGRAQIEGWLRNDAARALFSAAGLDFDALCKAASHAGFKPVLMTAALTASLHNSIRQFDSSNVVALLPGARRAQEYVVFVSHWDGLGSGFAGAVDGASGAAGLVTLAQSFVRTQPRADRSIVFLAATGAIAGQIGAQYYADNPIFPLRTTAAVIDLDMLPDGGHSRDVDIYAFGNTSLEDYAREAALLQGRESHSESNPERGTYYVAESYAFASHGVPVLLARSGNDDAARGPAWGKARREEYFATRFRQAGDQYSDAWDVVGALDDLSMDYEVGNALARSRRFPRWYPNSEFRGVHGGAHRVPGGGDGRAAP